MPREKTLTRRVLNHESVDYSAYTIAQLQETIEKLVEKIEQRKPRKASNPRPTVNAARLRRYVDKISKEIDKLD